MSTEPKILVFGDVCIDSYYVGDPKGLSAEAPVPVLALARTVTLPGMAANVSVLLHSLEIKYEMVLDSDAHFAIKNRVITSDGHLIVRWDFEDFCSPYTPDLFEDVDTQITSVTGIIVADYGKGAIDAYTRGKLLSYATQGIPLYVDTKGDPLLWLGENITLFPNSVEYKTWEANYKWLPSVVYKRGGEGMAYLKYGHPQFAQPALASVVSNVCGAGDMVIAAWATSRAKGMNEQRSLEYASEAAACLVEQEFWERSVTWEDIVGRCAYRRCDGDYADGFESE